MKTLAKLAVISSFLFAAPWTHADDAHHAQASSPVASANTEMSEGEIKKVDMENGKLTIKHGELKNLDMPPMTMVFRVKDKALLEQVKPGDKINFVAEKLDGKLTVVQLNPIQ